MSESLTESTSVESTSVEQKNLNLAALSVLCHLCAGDWGRESLDGQAAAQAADFLAERVSSVTEADLRLRLLSLSSQIAAWGEAAVAMHVVRMGHRLEKLLDNAERQLVDQFSAECRSILQGGGVSAGGNGCR